MPNKDDGLAMGTMKSPRVAEGDIVFGGTDTLAASFGPPLERPPGKGFNRLEDLLGAFPQFSGEPIQETVQFDETGKMEISFG